MWKVGSLSRETLAYPAPLLNVHTPGVMGFVDFSYRRACRRCSRTPIAGAAAFNFAQSRS